MESELYLYLYLCILLEMRLLAHFFRYFYVW